MLPRRPLHHTMGDALQPRIVLNHTAHAAAFQPHSRQIVAICLELQFLSYPSLRVTTMIPKDILHQTVFKVFTDYLESHPTHQPPSDVYHTFLQHTESALFEAVLAYTKGNVSKSASILGMNRTTLSKKIKQIKNK